jgi:general secretion pathway protein M
MNELKEWFDNLQAQERYYVIGGGIALVLLVFYLMIWAPLSSSVSTHRETAAQLRTDLEWMQAAGKQLVQLQRERPQGGSRNRSLLAVIDQEVQAAGLKGSLQRMEPEGPNSVKIWINSGSFDAMVSMLGKLENEQGIGVKLLSVNPAAATGLIDARITLTRG